MVEGRRYLCFQLTCTGNDVTGYSTIWHIHTVVGMARFQCRFYNDRVWLEQASGSYGRDQYN